jgi:hypothetical protein
VAASGLERSQSMQVAIMPISATFGTIYLMLLPLPKYMLAPEYPKQQSINGLTKQK